MNTSHEGNTALRSPKCRPHIVGCGVLDGRAILCAGTVDDISPSINNATLAINYRLVEIETI